MLVVQLQVHGGDVIRVGHVVIDRRAGHAMGARAIRLGPANCRVDRHVDHVNA